MSVAPARLLRAPVDRGVMGVAGTAGTVASREALIEAVRAGERVKYLHFWGHRPLPDGRIGPSLRITFMDLHLFLFSSPCYLMLIVSSLLF